MISKYNLSILLLIGLLACLIVFYCTQIKKNIEGKTDKMQEMSSKYVNDKKIGFSVYFFPFLCAARDPKRIYNSHYCNGVPAIFTSDLVVTS